MKTLIRLPLFAALLLCAIVFGQPAMPDLDNPEDLKALGSGRIVEKDKTIITNIQLVEVHDYWIVYLKQGSLHDLLLERIDRIEFPDNRWDGIKVKIVDNSPVVSPLPFAGYAKLIDP